MEKTYRLGLVGLALAGTAMFGGMTRETRAADAEINNAIDRIGGAAAEALSNIERSQGNPEKAAGYRALSNIFGDSARINYDSSQREKDRQTLLEAARIRAGGGEQNAELQRQIEENNRLRRQVLEQNQRMQQQSQVQQQPVIKTWDAKYEASAAGRSEYEREVKDWIAKEADVVFTCKDWRDKNNNKIIDMDEFEDLGRVYSQSQTITVGYRQFNFTQQPIDVNYKLFSLKPAAGSQLSEKIQIESGKLYTVPANMQIRHFKLLRPSPGAYIFRAENGNEVTETLFFVTERESTQANARPMANPKQDFDIEVGYMKLKDKELQITRKATFEADDDLECFVPYTREMTGKLVSISIYDTNTNIFYRKNVLIDLSEGEGKVLQYNCANLRNGFYCLKAEVDGDKIGIYERKKWFEVKDKQDQVNVGQRQYK